MTDAVAAGSPNVLQGPFFSTAFHVGDDRSFKADPEVTRMRERFDIFSGEKDGRLLYCLTGKDVPPRTRLQVAREAILGLLADARASPIAMEDGEGWVATLQRHLARDEGIVLIHPCHDGSEYQTYIAADCAGWTRAA